MNQIYWQPTNEPAGMMTQRSFRIAAAISTPKGQRMDAQMYWSYLADRVQEMITKSEDPEAIVAEMTARLIDADLLGSAPEQVETASRQLVRENANLQAYLIREGVLETLPKKMLMDSPDAKSAIEKTDWETWTDSVTEGVHSN